MKSIRTAAGPLAMLVAVVAALSNTYAHAQTGVKADSSKKPDSGKFAFTIQGQKVGTCVFKFDAAGASEGNVEVSLGGQDKKYVVKTSSMAGKLTGFSAEENSNNRFIASIVGTVAKVSINGGAAASQTIPMGLQPFGNFCPYLMTYTVAAYDSKKGGDQTFNMGLVEGLPNGQIATLKMKVAAKGAREIKVDTKTATVKTYSLAIDANGATIAISLFADADGHVLGWDVPAQSFTAVRVGYETVIATLEGPAKLN